MPTDEDGLDVDALEACSRASEIRMLAIQPRLHNPTGRDLSPARRERLLELARRHGFFLLEDGIYGDLRFAGDEPLLAARRGARARRSTSIRSRRRRRRPAARLGRRERPGARPDRRREARRRHPHADAEPARRSRAISPAAPTRRRSSARGDFYRERLEAMRGSIDEHLGPIASFIEPLGGGHVWVELDVAAGRARARRRGDPPGRRLRAGRRDADRAAAGAQPAALVRLLEPEEIDEGATAAGPGAARPAPPAGAPPGVPV